MRKTPTLFRLALLALALIALNSRADDPVPSHSKPVKQCRIETYDDCFLSRPDFFRYPSQAFELRHPNSSSRVAVLVHGLTDSPYYMKDIAAILYENGYDVRAILLDGHGTDITDMFDVELDTWRKQVRDAVDDELKQNRTVLVAGFSTGGALAIDLALDSSTPLQGILLFSPAIEIAARFSSFSCLFKAFTRWARDGDANEDNPSRYNRMPMNGVCQLQKLTSRISGRADELTLPVFSVITEYDKTISVEAMLDYLQEIGDRNSSSRHVLILNPHNAIDESIANAHRYLSEGDISHSDVPLRHNVFNARNNPLYVSISLQMKRFLNDINHLEPDASDSLDESGAGDANQH